MKVTVFGIGYVGLIQAAVLSDGRHLSNPECMEEKEFIYYAIDRGQSIKPSSTSL